MGVCLRCQYWPQTASSWVERCQQEKWPDKDKLTDIISHGCHVMPIGSMNDSNDDKLEWRLPFSMAEQKKRFFQ